MIAKGSAYFNNIRFSDECKIMLGPSGIQFVRKREDESWNDNRFLYEKPKGGAKCIMIWAMIDTIGLVRMKWLNEHKKRIDSQYFIDEILKKHVICFKEFQIGNRAGWVY